MCILRFNLLRKIKIIGPKCKSALKLEYVNWKLTNYSLIQREKSAFFHNTSTYTRTENK